ncbi:hypothetical protein [Nonomuraea jabiensis]|uniref:hypothetical protein n=1 Tax=Nonomuraea jabiensis TaxID=882448 RepID=UPI0036C21DFB
MRGRSGSLRRERRVLDEMERALRRECPELEMSMTLLDAGGPWQGRGPGTANHPESGPEVGAWEFAGVLVVTVAFVFLMIAVTLWR